MSKSILLAVTFFLIGNLVIIGLGINNAAEQAKIETRQKMRAVVSYEVDYDAFRKYVEDLDEEAQQEAYKNYPSVTKMCIRDRGSCVQNARWSRRSAVLPETRMAASSCTAIR